MKIPRNAEILCVKIYVFSLILIISDLSVDIRQSTLL